jgi:hypothetical protein
MKTESTAECLKLRVIARVSLPLLAITTLTSFAFYYRMRNLEGFRPVAEVYGFYEFCEALAPEGGTVAISVRRDPLLVTVNAASAEEYERLQEKVTSSMLTTAGAIEIRFEDRVFRYVPPAVP